MCLQKHNHIFFFFNKLAQFPANCVITPENELWFVCSVIDLWHFAAKGIQTVDNLTQDIYLFIMFYKSLLVLRMLQ